MALQKNTLATSAHLFERVMRKMNLDSFDDLQHLMIAFPHLHMREGFKLDAYIAGSKNCAVMKLYARAVRPTGRYMPVPLNEMDDQNGHINLQQIDKWDEVICKDKEIIPFIEGQFIHNTIPFWASETVPSVADYLEMNITPKAVWEAVMLIKASPLYLQHKWEGCYNSGMLVVDIVSLWMACLSVNINCEPMTDDNRIHPSVEIISDSEAIVKYCYWNQWLGLMRKTVKVSNKGKGITLEDLDQECILEYHCKIKY